MTYKVQNQLDVLHSSKSARCPRLTSNICVNIAYFDYLILFRPNFDNKCFISAKSRVCDEHMILKGKYADKVSLRGKKSLDQQGEFGLWLPGSGSALLAQPPPIQLRRGQLCIFLPLPKWGRFHKILYQRRWEGSLSGRAVSVSQAGPLSVQRLQKNTEKKMG